MANVSEDPTSPAPADGVHAPPPPPYPANPQYVAYGYGAPVRQTNVLAIISLVASCVGLLFPLAYVGGIVTGHIALSQIKRTREGGHGLALAGVIIGYSLLAVWIIFVVIYVVFIVAILGAAAVHGNLDS